MNAINWTFLAIASLLCSIAVFSTFVLASDMGPLTTIIQSSEDDSWLVDNRGESVLLENRQAAGDLIYFFVNPIPDQEGHRTVSVDIEISNIQTNSMAGLLYGFELQPKSYFLFTVNSDDIFNVHYLANGQFEQLTSTSFEGQRSSALSLSIQETGRRVSFMAGDKLVGSLENERTGRGALGIVAANVGTYTFENFDISLNGKIKSNNNTTATNKNQLPVVAHTRSRSELSLVDFVDEQIGMVMVSMPFPAGWQADINPNDKLAITGPRGASVYNTDSGRHIYSDDPFARQSAQQTGTSVAPLIPVQQYLNQQFSKYMSAGGFSLINTYRVPEIAAFWELFAVGMPQGLSKKSHDVIAAEWEHGDGTKALTVLVQTILQQPLFTIWQVSVGELYTVTSEFATASKDYIHALSNAVVNADWQITKNNELLARIKADRETWDERTKHAKIQHINRMNSILTRTPSSSSIAKINSDILDISHSGYLKRSNMMSEGQARSVNMVGEHSIISNSSTGEFYKVDAGVSHYWVNKRGKYFGTENSLYDPRVDSGISNQGWTKFDVVQ